MGTFAAISLRPESGHSVPGHSLPTANTGITSPFWQQRSHLFRLGRAGSGTSTSGCGSKGSFWRISALLARCFESSNST